MSRESGGTAPYSVRMRATGPKGEHISGAEGIYDTSTSANKAVSLYAARAMSHPRGEPAEVIITVERLRRKPCLVAALPVSTMECATPSLAEVAIRDLLLEQGVSARAINAGLRIIKGKRVMRGAAVIDGSTGRRCEPDRRRGVRATLMGVDPRFRPKLARRLARMGINTPTVMEALTLASKAASAPGMVAELCASDDPDYTTGYLASPRMGYVRITNIKPLGGMSGGRVFFIKPGADTSRLVRYLEEMPVLVG